MNHRMRLKFSSFGVLMVAIASCTQPVKIRLHNYSASQIDVRIAEESNLVGPRKSFQFPVLSFGDFAIVVDSQPLRYESHSFDPDYVQRTRCGWTYFRVVHIRFDDDQKIRIVHPKRWDDTQIPLTQPEGFPLDPKGN